MGRPANYCGEASGEHILFDVVRPRPWKCRAFLRVNLWVRIEWIARRLQNRDYYQLKADTPSANAIVTRRRSRHDRTPSFFTMSNSPLRGLTRSRSRSRGALVRPGWCVISLYLRRLRRICAAVADASAGEPAVTLATASRPAPK